MPSFADYTDYSALEQKVEELTSLRGTNLSGNRFIIKELRHASSLEADKVKRYFYETVMEKID